MSPIQSLSTALQLLPSAARKAIYYGLALIGVALAGCDTLQITDLGAVTTAQVLQVYTYLSPLIAVVAVANVKPAGTTLPDPNVAGEDFDLSSFGPVGDPEDVYGQG